jgi:hypothetical protein
MPETLKVNALIVLASALVWVVAFKLHDLMLPMTALSAGIDLIFIPSGIRFFALLIGGVWAAVGVALGSLLLAGSEFGLRSPVEIAGIAVCSGFAPYASLLATQRLLGIDRNLTNLFPRHLPVLALGTAIGSAVIHNCLFLLFGLSSAGSIFSRSFAMAAGDFAGSLMMVILVIGGMRLYRRRQ